jgi:hypothetical protein
MGRFCRDRVKVAPCVHEPNIISKSELLRAEETPTFGTPGKVPYERDLQASVSGGRSESDFYRVSVYNKEVENDSSQQKRV